MGNKDNKEIKTNKAKLDNAKADNAKADNAKAVNAKADNAKAVNAKSKVEKDSNGKIITNYDKKILKRKEEEAKAKRNLKMFKISCVVVLLAVLVGIGSYFVVKHNTAYGEYITVGDSEISKIEFDYYYNTSANNFISSYSQYLSYIGLDTSKSFEDQEYSADLSWADYFDQSAAEMIKETKAMVADAKANNFQYDVADDYKSYIESIETSASTNSVSVKQYYKDAFGNYASEKNLKDIIEQYLTATAYYTQLTELNATTDAEVAAYYADNKDTYDSIDYRVLSVETEAAAKEMASKITDETSFRALCTTYATADTKATYETDDASLMEGGTASSISTAYSAWLYDSSRKYGDITVLEDTENSVFCVVYFINRYYDDATNQTISDKLTSDAVTSYIGNLTSALTITDKKNHLKYLTIETEAATE